MAITQTHKRDEAQRRVLETFCFIQTGENIPALESDLPDCIRSDLRLLEKIMSRLPKEHVEYLEHVLDSFAN